MKNQLFKLPLSLLVLLLGAFPPLLIAQNMAFAQNTPQRNYVRQNVSASTKRLKDVLNDLSQQHQVSILFEEATVQGIMVNPDKIKSGRLESKLDVLLNPSNLTYKKDAEAKLPVTATQYGRITKGAAQFLLSRVYLTRGWNFKGALGGSAADFTLALQYADKVIDGYPLAATYAALFPTHVENPLKQFTGTQNDKNAEIIFAVQYNADALSNKTDPAFVVDPAGGNNLHSMAATAKSIQAQKDGQRTITAIKLFTSRRQRCTVFLTPTMIHVMTLIS
jgi:hypothetical protein